MELSLNPLLSTQWESLATLRAFAIATTTFALLSVRETTRRLAAGSKGKRIARSMQGLLWVFLVALLLLLGEQVTTEAPVRCTLGVLLLYIGISTTPVLLARLARGEDYA